MSIHVEVPRLGSEKQGVKHRYRATPKSSAPVVMKQVPSVGRRAHLHCDPVTGRKKAKP